MSNVPDEEIRTRLSPFKNLPGSYYQHYKTKAIYQVDQVAVAEDDMTTVLITYHPVAKPDMHFVRTASNFMEHISDEHVNKGYVGRFTRVPGSALTSKLDPS